MSAPPAQKLAVVLMVVTEVELFRLANEEHASALWAVLFWLGVVVTIAVTRLPWTRPDQPMIHITLPRWMLDDLRATAKERDCTVTEHIRRCVSLHRHIWGQDPDAEIEVRYSDGRSERIRPDPCRSPGSGVITKETP